jgi:hypothetical protein
MIRRIYFSAKQIESKSQADKCNCRFRNVWLGTVKEEASTIAKYKGDAIDNKPIGKI